MSHKNKVHSDSYTKLSVPFRWEKQPGVSISSKPIMEPAKDQPFLPLPPCWSHQNKATRRRAIISPSSSCSKGAFGNHLAGFEKDPFLVAFKECTKPNSDPAKPGMEPRVGNMVTRKGFFRFCCKKSCGVRDDALVKIRLNSSYL